MVWTPTRGHDPKTAAELRPALCFTEQPHESANVAVRNGRLSSHERLSRFVVNVYVTVLSVIAHGSAVSALSRVAHDGFPATFGASPLPDDLSLPAPNDDE